MFKYLDLYYEEQDINRYHNVFVRKAEMGLLTKNMGTEFIAMINDMGLDLKRMEQIGDCFTFEEDGIEFHCICSHVIRNGYIIGDDHGNKILVGSDCVEKVNPELYKKLKSEHRCIVCRDKIIGDRRKQPYRSDFCSYICKNIGERCKDTKSRFWKDIHKNIVDMVNNRCCLDCKKYNIQKTEPLWKIRCLECWYKWKKPSSKSGGKKLE